MIDKYIDDDYTEYFTPVCDYCGEELEPETSFFDAVEAKKDAGWKPRQVNGYWKDICPDCQKKQAAAKKTKETYNNAKVREILKKRRAK